MRQHGSEIEMGTAVIFATMDERIDYFFNRCHASSSKIGMKKDEFTMNTYSKRLTGFVNGVKMAILIYTDQADWTVRNTFEIQFHLSKFKSMKSFYEWLMEICQCREVFDFINAANLRRIDLCVDVRADLFYFQDNFHIPGVRKISSETSNRESYQMGVYPRKTIFYVKDEAEIFGIDFQFNDENDYYDHSDVIRAEVGLENKFLPARSLKDITYEKFKELKPFNHLRQHKLNYNLFNAAPQSTKDRLTEFIFLSMKIGHQRASKTFSRNRSFHRDIGPYFNQAQSIELQSAYENRIQRFFEVSQPSKSIPALEYNDHKYPFQTLDLSNIHSYKPVITSSLGDIHE